MHTEKYIELLQKPSLVSKKQTATLEEILTIFPYFQSARVIQLKGLKKQHSFLYNKALKKTAAYTTNRTVLFDFISFDVLSLEKSLSLKEKDLTEIEVIDSKLILKQTKTSKEEEYHKIEQVLEVGKPLDFKKEDAYSFNQWLQLSQDLSASSKKKKKTTTGNLDLHQKTQEKSINNEKKSIKKIDKKLDLIERFLEKKPKIKPIKKTANIDVVKDSIQDDTSLMTETLARVYVEQKKYDKAIQAFRILSLKYPEKSSFFADRIKAVEFLKNN